MEYHARRRVPHNLADSLLRLAALAMGGTVLAVALMAVGTYGRARQRCLYRFAA